MRSQPPTGDLREAVRKLVDTFPPLNEAQIARLRPLLRDLDEPPTPERDVESLFASRD